MLDIDFSKLKFDSSVDIAVNLGVDPKKLELIYK